MDQQTGGIVGEIQNGDEVCFLAAHRRFCFDTGDVDPEFTLLLTFSRESRRVEVANRDPEHINDPAIMDFPEADQPALRGIVGDLGNTLIRFSYHAKNRFKAR